MFNRFDAGDGTLGLIDFSGTSGSPRSSIDWNGIINQGFALGSHAISAFSGQNSGTQIGYNRSQGVFAIQGNQPSGNYSASPYAGMSAEQMAAYQRSAGVGGTVGSGVDGIFNWLMSNPLITFGGIAGLYLLFREPPRRR
jgi:hypothetical protein